jgi:hypothetical protein
MPISVGLNADGDRRYHWLLMPVWLEQDANLRRTYGRCLAPKMLPSLGHDGQNIQRRVRLIAEERRP